MSLKIAYTKGEKICGRFLSKTSAYFLLPFLDCPQTRGGRAYNSLRSLSQLGRGRILMPDTSPMAMNSVRVEDPP